MFFGLEISGQKSSPSLNWSYNESCSFRTAGQSRRWTHIPNNRRRCRTRRCCCRSGRQGYCISPTPHEWLWYLLLLATPAFYTATTHSCNGNNVAATSNQTKTRRELHTNVRYKPSWLLQLCEHERKSRLYFSDEACLRFYIEGSLILEFASPCRIPIRENTSTAKGTYSGNARDTVASTLKEKIKKKVMACRTVVLH